jgi:HKD family nuclease
VLEREIDSADQIDAVIAFIRWSGLRLIAPRLREFVQRGGRLRVITSTYTGSTERLAIERLKTSART